EEKKYDEENVIEVLGNREAPEYYDKLETEWVDEQVELEDEIESFTADSLFREQVQNSEVRGIEVDTDRGMFNIVTYNSAESDEGWGFWIPYLDDVEGKLVGRVSAPSGSESEASVILSMTAWRWMAGWMTMSWM
ncbi:MAG: hypothetical protein ABEJ66_03225, partial [Candidatus Nanohaloarchaea archaeon]